MPDSWKPALSAAGIVVAAVVGMSYALSERIGDVRSSVVEAEGRLTKQIGAVKADHDKKIDDLKTEINGKIDGLKADLDKKIDGLKADLNKRIDDVVHEIRTASGRGGAIQPTVAQPTAATPTTVGPGSGPTAKENPLVVPKGKGGGLKHPPATPVIRVPAVGR